MSSTNSTEEAKNSQEDISTEESVDTRVIEDQDVNTSSDDNSFFDANSVVDNNVDNNNENENEDNNSTANDDATVEVVAEVELDAEVENDDNDNETVASAGIINNIVTIDTIRDNVVAANTSKSYMSDIIKFIEWIIENEPIWLTDNGREQLDEIFIQCANESRRVYRGRVTLDIKNLLRNSYTHPLLVLHRIRPARYIDFILTIRGRNGRYMSKSAYGNKRASLYHLFRLHNRQGYPEEFKTELGSLFKGFYRQITDDRTQGNAGVSNKEGKEPMSVELYKSVCRWLLNHGTTDGVFAYCYLVLTWNLACRSGNTSRIQYNDIAWTSSFDSFSIAFGHLKTDQLGEEAKYPRHLFANPLSPIVCPVTALGIYFTCCFNTVHSDRGRLFPGQYQESRFSGLLQSVIAENWELVSEMGYLDGEIGTHSIRKGAVSFLSSLPGGPPAAATCIRAGWTMGKVKDVYMRYVTSGDQFVGRSLCLLSVLKPDFGASPPHFLLEEYDWIEPTRTLQFPMVSNVQSLKKLSRMALASLLYHHGWLSSIMQVNHVFLTCSAIHRLQNMATKAEFVHVTYPWKDDNNNSFSGIPPHALIIQSLSTIQDGQARLVTQFIDRMTGLLEQMGVNGGRMSEENLRNILQDFQQQFRQQMVVGGVHDVPLVVIHNNINQLEATRIYNFHHYDGAFHRVPADCRFPRCGVFDVFRQWYIGDGVRNIPPLSKLKGHHFSHLDNLPLDDDEMHGRTGRHRGRRRPANKIFSDLKFLMNFLHNKIVERDAFPAEITAESVDAMFLAVADVLTAKERDAQIRWSSVVVSVRNRVRGHRG